MSQLNLRLPPDVAALLDTAHGRVGPLVARHRLAVLALAIGLREVARDPAVLFTTERPTVSPSVTPHPTATQRDTERPTTSPARAPRDRSKTSKTSKTSKAPRGRDRSKTSRTAAATAARWEPVAESDRVKLARDLVAHLDAGGRGAVDRVVKATGVHRSAVYNARKGAVGVEVFKMLRGYLDAASPIG